MRTRGRPCRACGPVVAAGVLALDLDAYPAVPVLAVLQIATELVIGRHRGVAMVVITPPALPMNQLAAPRPIGQLLWDRGVETVIGAAVACAVILLAARQRPADQRLSIRLRMSSSAASNARGGPGLNTPPGRRNT
ncbi:FUSC family protein [Actinoplanes sp. NPDC020271]|uniref:FUSC family protein n=1 Tax=Actinoplanes sp. NPDC020271 TaxID=3363896 RepID=UPI0037B2EDC3